MKLALAVAALLLAAPTSPQPQVAPAAEAPGLRPLPMRVIGRAVRERGFWVRQWPGTIFETAFAGGEARFRLGPGEAALAISVDGREVARLTRPGVRLYRVSGLGPARHVLRVQVATESQSGPTRFGGFLAGRGTRPVPLPAARPTIRFVGDSHTVGYGNASAKRECTPEEVWATTDATRAVPALLARHYGADVEVEAISGRGVVRNYGGFRGDTLPEAYPYALLDRRFPWRNAGGGARLVVVALGTNDFSTPLKPGEKWPDRDALRADFEASYVGFLRRLRAESPRAFLLLWIVDSGNGEIAREVGRVTDRLRASGERKIAFVPVSGLAMTGCDWHPSAADDEKIAAALARFIDSRPGLRPRRRQ